MHKMFERFFIYKYLEPLFIYEKPSTHSKTKNVMYFCIQLIIATQNIYKIQIYDTNCKHVCLSIDVYALIYYIIVLKIKKQSYYTGSRKEGTPI